MKMKLSEFKNKLAALPSLIFIRPDGQWVPAHFHITELGVTTKHFIDCGGEIHSSKVMNMQLWVADDYNHRLFPASLLSIISIFEKIWYEDLEIEVEYQTDTVGKYSLAMTNRNTSFLLVPTKTDCLAKIKCNIPQGKNSCTPGGKCC